MKLWHGVLFLVLYVAAGAMSADAAFWNRKQAKEEPVAAVEAPPPVAAVAAEAVPAARRVHARLADDASVGVLVQLAESRRLREQEIEVLTRLHIEKEGELGRMNERLLGEFGIDAEANYQYDNQTKSLHLLVPREGASAEDGAAAGDRFERRLHRTLDERETEIAFVRLVSAKKITASELQVLKLLLKEKRLELGKVNQTLSERFSVRPEKHYEFDPASRTLFEVIGPAGGVSGGNAGP